MAESPDTILLALGTSTAAILLAIVVMTFLMEDLATAGAAMLAAAGTISPVAAASSLFVGIFLGDLSLYALGAVARKHPWTLARIGTNRLSRGQDWLRQRYVTALIAARCLPGMRLPTFTASGFLSMPFGTFFAVMLIAGVAWTAVIFTLVYSFGIAIAESLGPWRWVAALALIAFVLSGPRIARFLMSRGKTDQ
jgi:membrane protein DedA with SNARE-associated domain